MKCPHCSQPVAIEDDACSHCGVRLPPGRVEMGPDSGCMIAVLFVALVAIGLCGFSGIFLPRWLWQALF